MDARVEFPQTALSAAGRGAHLPRRWTGDRVTNVFTLALAFPLATGLYETGGGILPLLLGSLLVAVGWTLLFTRLRGKDMNWHAVPTAIAFSLMVPPAVPLWQALLALSFGVVVGEQVFGGRGYSFLHPAVAALAFLFFSFPAATAEQTGPQLVAAAVIPGAALLLASGLISWRILLAVLLGFSGWMLLKGLGVPTATVLTSSLALGVVYLVCEPTSAAATNPGRWAYGLLVGMLIVILGKAGQGIGATAAVVFAALLGSIFAPLIDRIVIRINVNRRKRRQWPT
jgi:Na+-transporting NADH:ubiquinone oxidoreductase, subunit NqrB